MPETSSPDRATLRTLTFDKHPPLTAVKQPTPSPRCRNNSYTCICDEHTAERIRRVRKGVKSTRQPWQARKAA